jgi:hypothetical protein
MRGILALLVVLVAPQALSADDVYLKNGRVFKDVETVVGEGSVRILLPFGEMGISLAKVERIEQAESSHALFLERRAGLRVDDRATAGDWLDLARWARGRGLDHAAREAALTAARLDPREPGLATVMQGLDFAFSAELDRWVPFEESMRMKGFEFVDGRWMSAEQRRARALEMNVARQTREAAEDRRLANAVLALAAAQMARPAPLPPQTAVYGLPLFTAPPPPAWHNPFSPGFFGPQSRSPIDRGQPGGRTPTQRRARGHRGSFARASPSAQAGTSGG